MTTTVTIAVIERKITGEILFAEQCKDQYAEVSFQIGFLRYDQFMEMVAAKWDEPREFKDHVQETDNYLLNLIEKEIEL